MFPEFRTFETTLAGRPLKVETGKMAGLAGGSCLDERIAAEIEL